MKDREKIQQLHSFQDAKYENIDLDHLIMYVMDQLKMLKADLSFENAVVASFKLFPKKFSLPGFPEYPDSNRVEQCLWRCTYKTKQWLGGKSRQGFIITERSKMIINETEGLLGKSSSKTKKTQTTSQTRRKESILAEILSSPAYLKYSKNQTNSISEAEFCFLLQGTLDSSRETLQGNLTSLKKYAEELQRDDISTFLDRLNERFQGFLGHKQG